MALGGDVCGGYRLCLCAAPVPAAGTASAVWRATLRGTSLGWASLPSWDNVHRATRVWAGLPVQGNRWVNQAQIPATEVLVLGVSVPCRGQQEGEPLQVKAVIFSHLQCFPPTFTEIHPCCTQIWIEKNTVWHGECEFLVEQREWEYSVPTAVCSHSPWWAQHSQQHAAFSPARDRVQSSIQPAICWGDLVIFSHLQLWGLG